jgi:hypothetical protein
MLAIWLPAARSQSVTPLCSPKILANQLVASAAQRAAAGDIAQPPLTDLADGFAWPDTPVGAIKNGGGYAFFGSDGGSHARQFWQGSWYGKVNPPLMSLQLAAGTTRGYWDASFIFITRGIRRMAPAGMAPL